MSLELPQIHIVNDEETLQRVCRFRYQTYINELGTTYGQITLDNGMLRDELDEFGVTLYAEDQGLIVGTARLNFGDMGEFDHYWFDCYQLDEFPDLTKVCLASKMMISPQWRASGLSQKMIELAFAQCVEHQTEFLFLDCIIPLVQLYERMGFRRYKANAPEDANLKYYVPLILVLNDHQYFCKVNSPLQNLTLIHHRNLASTQWFNNWCQQSVGFCDERFLSKSERLSLIQALDNPPELFKNISLDEQNQLIENSTILQVSQEDTLSYQGDTCDSLFLLVQGEFKRTQHTDTAHEQIIEYFYPGSTMGIKNFIELSKRQSSLMALTDSVVVVFSQSMMRSVTSKYPSVFSRLKVNIDTLYDLDQSPYRYTEKEISKHSGQEISVPIRVFKLQKLGVDQVALTQLLLHNQDHLAWDHYDQRRARLNLLKFALPQLHAQINDLENSYYYGQITEDSLLELISLLDDTQTQRFWAIEPHRRRAISQFSIQKSSTCEWEIKRIYDQAFTQNVNDYRKLERSFVQTPELITGHSSFQSLLQAMTKLTLECRPHAKRLNMIVHEMCTTTNVNRQGENSPEGIHQDGSMFIVSALLLKRSAITGGKSMIYGPDHTRPYFEYTLQPGEGIFQMDRHTQLWHKVTPIELEQNSDALLGERSVLGFDIEVIE